MKVLGIALMAFSAAAGAWTQPVYKCGNSYSDEPCKGGQKVDVLPTEGAHSMSGTKRRSGEVELRNAKRNLYKALEPVTGVPAKEMEKRAGQQQYEQKERIRIHRQPSED